MRGGTFLMQKWKTQYKGFTLIELLIVIAIIAILAAIAIPNFLLAQVRAKVSGAMSDMKSLATALEAYYVDNNAYPWTNLGLYNRTQRLAALTTPVAYFGGKLPYDKFNAGKEIPEQRVYPYWDPPYFVYLSRGSDGARFADIPDLYWRYKQGKPTWVLMSYGPDQDFEAAVPPYLGCLYDPTNGTVTNGDIMRWGP